MWIRRYTGVNHRVCDRRHDALDSGTSRVAAGLVRLLRSVTLRMEATTRTHPLRDLLALTKPGITVANTLMAGAGLLVAERAPSIVQAMSVLVGTALVVAAANTFNMVLERRQDAVMERTCDRPLAAGRLAARTAWLFGAALSALGGVILYMGANLPTALLGLGAVAMYAFVYTPMKRMTPLALHVGAIPGAVPPLMGVMAVTPESPTPGLCLFAAVFLWQFPHFLAIAVRRRDDYARAGIRAWSVVFGEAGAHRLSRWAALLLVPVGLLPTLSGGAGVIAALGMVGLAAWLAYAAWPSRAWVKPTFLASLAYLPALPIILGLDRLVA